MTTSKKLLTTLLLLAAGPAHAQLTFFDLRPAEPQTFSPVTISFTYQPGCPPSYDLETEDNTVRITVTEGCSCPPVIYPPETHSFTIGPLARGHYDVELLLRRIENPPSPTCNQTSVLGTTEFEVFPAGGFIAVTTQPATPTTAEPTRLAIDSFCPNIFQLLEPLDSHFLRLQQLQSPFGPPCSNTEPFWRYELDLGQLAAGHYAGMILDSEGTRIIDVFSFTVSEASNDALLLRGGRFRVEATWTDFGGNRDRAQAVQLTDDSGYFWFFDPANAEILAKVIEGCGLNDHRWFFAAGLTNVGVAITVTDTFTGEMRPYGNPLGRSFQPILDTEAFGGCP